MSQNAKLAIDTGLDVYFCNPHNPWVQGTNANANGRLRQYFPKVMDLSMSIGAVKGPPVDFC
jgi:IS30 family transposase